MVGGGPAGLRAAEVLAEAGCRVNLYEGKPSVGRKFLVAGRGGLNLTHSEGMDRFVLRYGEETDRWTDLLAGFGPVELRNWAENLGVETYVGTSGRVFPRGQQAAVLLRGWVARLRTLGVQFHVNHRLESLTKDTDGQWRSRFHEVRNDGRCEAAANAVVLALGGASWPQTGSDGKWPKVLHPLGMPVAPWQAANCGWEVRWGERFLAVAEGMPLKNLAVTAGMCTVSGELLVTRYGLEGGALYQLGRELRAMGSPRLFIDFKPGLKVPQLLARMPGGTGHLVEDWPKIARSWKLSPAVAALLCCHGAGKNQSIEQVAQLAKNFPLELQGPRPVEEAISSAGGVQWNALSEDLAVVHQPGLFVAGEMIDWEAPTGGYLLQGCFATGTRAGRAAARYLQAEESIFRKVPSA